MTIERVQIVAHPKKDGVPELRAELESFLSERGVAVSDERPDLILSLGGDGTTLRSAQLAHAANAYLLGVNLGAMGYLTEIEAGEEKQSLERVLAGDFRVEERMVLRCSVGDGAGRIGLNEVLVERSERTRLVHLKVDVGGEHLAGFDADGVMVATPTGSTAYALSAGGPIVDPRAECLIIVPVSPHMFFSRPVVLSADEVVQITVTDERSEASITLDGGDGTRLDVGSTVTIRRDPKPIRFVKLSGPGFVERLRVKLRLPE